MTIDEAIAHAREVAKTKEKEKCVCGTCKHIRKSDIHPRQGYCYKNECGIHYEVDLSRNACDGYSPKSDLVSNDLECYKQLAEWLEELKDHRDKNKIVCKIDVLNMDELLVKVKEAYEKGRAEGYSKAENDYFKKNEEILQQQFDYGYNKAISNVREKMYEVIANKCAEYGVACRDAYTDAYLELEDWIK